MTKVWAIIEEMFDGSSLVGVYSTEKLANEKADDLQRKEDAKHAGYLKSQFIVGDYELDKDYHYED